MRTEFKYDIFLSHNQADKPRVRRLAERLNGVGGRAWLDELAIQAGDRTDLRVDQGLENSRMQQLCISLVALASGWVAQGLSPAAHRDAADDHLRFTMPLLGNCTHPDTLRRSKYVDYREDVDAAFAEALVTWQMGMESEYLDLAIQT